MSTEIKTSDAMAARIAELQARLAEFSTASIKSELASLQKRQIDVLVRERQERDALEQRLHDETAELERAYELAIANLEGYVTAAEAVLALKPQWNRTWHEANRAGLEVPTRTPDFSHRATKDADVRSIANRALTIRTSF